MCITLCYVSVEGKVVSGVLVWCSISGKIAAVSALKVTSVGCQKFKTLCGRPFFPVVLILIIGTGSLEYNEIICFRFLAFSGRLRKFVKYKIIHNSLEIILKKLKKSLS